MCVVGSSWGGQENPNWEKNLALALALRNELNTVGKNICRPPYLKSSTYNQELAEYSLLIEVGAAGNSVEESCRAAELIAIALSKIL
jgi:stage II sporulation protein P